MTAPQSTRGAAVHETRVTKRALRGVRRGPTGLAVRVDAPVAWWVRRVGARYCVRDGGRWGLDRQDVTPSVFVFDAA